MPAVVVGVAAATAVDAGIAGCVDAGCVDAGVDADAGVVAVAAYGLARAQSYGSLPQST